MDGQDPSARGLERAAELHLSKGSEMENPLYPGREGRGERVSRGKQEARGEEDAGV